MSAEKDKLPTPETDSQLRTFDSLTKYGKRFTNRTGQVNADFARRLERQRDEARGWAEAAWAKSDRAEKMLRHAAAKADQWRECADALALAIRRDDETTDAALEVYDNLKLEASQ
jgi:hypothetical protein